MSYLIFDGVNLTDRFGLVLSGAGTYDAPARAVEGITIPGRSGNLLRDDGNYLNLDVTYAGCGLKLRDRSKLDELRAFLSARQGTYFQLADSYHLDEYRMARFVGPFIPTMSVALKLATFDLTFDCKPQRFLLSGDQATRFLAKPAASAYTYASYTDFAADVASDLMDAGLGAGYTRSQVTAMKFSVLPVDFSAIYATYGDVPLTFRCGWSQPYFWLATDSDPTTGSHVSEYGFSRGSSSWFLGSNYSFQYLIQPYGFNCAVLYGDTELVTDGLTASRVLLNPDGLPVKPIVKISVTGGTDPDNYVAGVNSCGIMVSGTIPASVTEITIDAETLDVYSDTDGNSSGVVINLNDIVSFSEDEMTLGTGENTIYTTNTGDVEIIPRWARL